MRRDYLIVRGKLKLAYGPSGPFLWAFWSPLIWAFWSPFVWAFWPPSQQPSKLRRVPSHGELLLLALVKHAQLDSPHRRLCAVGHTKLANDIAHVLLDSAHADKELSGYLLVCVSSRYQPKHLALAC